MEEFVFWGFNLHAWITIVTVLALFSILLFTKVRADAVFLGAMVILYVTGVLDAKEAFSGRRAVCGSSRSNLYRCAAMDSEEPVRSAQTMEQCSRKAHVTGRWTEFVPEQYYGSGAVYRDCEDVVEETWNRPVETVDSA